MWVREQNSSIATIAKKILKERDEGQGGMLDTIHIQRLVTAGYKAFP